MGSRPYIRSEQRQADIVEAVIRLCARSNPAELTTAGIARELNLSQGALFRHFPNKQSLWEAVARWVQHSLATRVLAVSEEYDSPRAGLEAMFMAHVAFIASHPGAPRLIFSELQKPEHSGAKTLIRQTLEHYRGHIRGLLENGMAQGEIRSDLDPEATAVLYLGSIQGLVMQSLVSADMTTATQAAPGVFELINEAIREPSHET